MPETTMITNAEATTLTIAELAVQAARQASGSLKELDEKFPGRDHPVKWGVAGARKRANEIIALIKANRDAMSSPARARLDAILDAQFKKAQRRTEEVAA